MKYLRLSVSPLENNEYFTGNDPIKYLENVKDLNILVGANNSRKSRFLRKILSLESKVIIDSPRNLNSILDKIDDNFKDLDQNLLNTKLLRFYFQTDGTDNFQLVRIQRYFDMRNTGKYEISFFDVLSNLKTIRSEIESIATADQVDPLIERISDAYTTFLLTLKIYRSFASKKYFDVLGRPFGTDIDGVNCVINEGFVGDLIIDLDRKITLLKFAVSFLDVLQNLSFEFYHKSKLIYIPVLRGSRNLHQTSKDTYVTTISNQYSLDKIHNLTIETGLDLYRKIDLAKSGYIENRRRFDEFQSFISDVFFQSQQFEIVAVKSASGSDSDVTVTIGGENNDVAIHHLGDGITSIINLLLPIYMADNGAWVFIDEPENHLHPGYQALFLNAISNTPFIVDKKLKFFINTHSNHILSESLLTAIPSEIFVFSRRDEKSSNVTSFNGNEYNTLDALGVLNTSVLVSNCSIWVEGITDRLYIRAFLHAYYKSVKNDTTPVEGLHYSFVEYAGNNLVHYSFNHNINNDSEADEQKIKAFFLNRNVFLIADSDFKKDHKHEFYENDQTDRFIYFKTEKPEIENILPDSVLKKWLVGSVGCSGSEVDTCFKKNIGNKKLGAYFDGNFTKKSGGHRKFMEDNKGGTLAPRYKTSLANYVYFEVMNGNIQWDDLKESDIILSLIDNLTEFIKKSNR